MTPQRLLIASLHISRVLYTQRLHARSPQHHSHLPALSEPRRPPDSLSLSLSLLRTPHAAAQSAERRTPEELEFRLFVENACAGPITPSEATRRANAVVGPGEPRRKHPVCVANTADQGEGLIGPNCVNPLGHGEQASTFDPRVLKPIQDEELTQSHSCYRVFVV